MTTRFYILPLDSQGGGRGPKYLKWILNPDGIDCVWSMKDYGRLDVAVVAANVTTEQHAELIGYSDVFAAPSNLDNTIPDITVRDNVRAKVEALNIPGQFINVGDSYRELLRTITHLFMFAQRYDGLYGEPIVQPANGITLDTVIADLPTEFRQRMLDCAHDLGYDTSGIQATDTYRQGLKYMADQWGETTVLFAFTSL